MSEQLNHQKGRSSAHPADWLGLTGMIRVHDSGSKQLDSLRYLKVKKSKNLVLFEKEDLCFKPRD